MRFTITAAFLSLSRAFAANPVIDRVVSLPGWSDPFRSARFSGFLKGSDASRHISYFFVESEGDPTTDPVVVWFNGGPGCSSYIGNWLEQGPLTMSGDGTLNENSGRWNANANVLFLESPAGVGFSYADFPATLPFAATDNSTAADSLGALIDFFTTYPAFAGRSLWLTGESYAGIYVPFLARAVLGSGDAVLAGSLRGVLVGNGALKMADGINGVLDRQRMEHASNHGLFSAALRTKIDTLCLNWTNPRVASCDAALAEVRGQVGNLNGYNIEETCLEGNASPQARALARFMLARDGEAAPSSLGAVDPCNLADDAITSYLNLPEVVTALHMDAGVAVMGPWSECAGGKTLNYTRYMVDETTEVYPGLLAAGLHVLIYNGDQDECIPYQHDETWTRGMGFAVRDEWRPWLLNEQVAGYVTEFEAPVTSGRFAFATVKRAGHEVPMYQPDRARALLERFITGVPL